MRRVTLDGMRLRLLAALLFLAAPFSSAADAPGEKEIRAIIAAQAAAWNAGSLEGFMAGYEKSADIRFVGSKGITRGWDAILARYQKSYADPAAMGKLTLDEFEFTPIGADYMLVLGHWKVTTEAKGDAEGRTTILFRRGPDGWKIIYDHSS